MSEEELIAEVAVGRCGMSAPAPPPPPPSLRLPPSSTSLSTLPMGNKRVLVEEPMHQAKGLLRGLGPSCAYAGIEFLHLGG